MENCLRPMFQTATEDFPTSEKYPGVAATIAHVDPAPFAMRPFRVRWILFCFAGILLSSGSVLP